jgi:hypothetical protein
MSTNYKCEYHNTYIIIKINRRKIKLAVYKILMNIQQMYKFLKRKLFINLFVLIYIS